MRLLVVLSFTLGATGLLYAQDSDEFTRKADAVIAAAKANDTDALVELAGGTEINAWLLAHELCARGELEAATALAKAATSKDFEKLPAYIELRRSKGDDAESRKVLRAVMRDLKSSNPRPILDATNGLEFTGDSILDVNLMAARAYALAVAERREESTDAFVLAAAEAERLGDYQSAVEGFEMGGNMAFMIQHYMASRTCRERVVALQVKRGNLRGEAEALVRVIQTHDRLGDVEPALEMYERLTALWEELGDNNRLGMSLANRAISYIQAGDHRKALELAERGLELTEGCKDLDVRATVLRQVASVHTLGNGKKALACQRQALKMREQQGNPYELAVGRMLFAQANANLKEWDQAIYYYGRALEYFESIGHPYVAYVLRALGNIHEHKKELDKAFACHKRAVQIAEASRDPRMLVMCISGIADAYLSGERYKEALPHLTRAVAIAEQVGHHDALLRTRFARASCLLYLKRPKEALGEVRPAVDIILRSYKGLGGEQGAEARARNAWVFSAGVQGAHEVGDPSLAFFYMESGRAGSLLESLGGRARLGRAAIPASLADEEKAARAAFSAARNEYKEAQRSRNLRKAKARKREFDVTAERLNEVVQKVQREQKSAGRVLYPRASTVEEVQARLAHDDAIVSYGVFSRKAMAIVLTKTSIRTVSLGDKEPIVEACDALALDDPDADPSVDLAKLRKLVVDPLGLDKKINRVLVSPDGVLSYVPFSVLVGGRDVVYIPSATTYKFLGDKREPAGKKVLALGDPKYDGSLKPLPHTRKEAKAVGDVVLLGSDATKARLAAALQKRGRWRAIHLACHGLVDLERPTLSSLAITDGKLTAYEALGMNFSSDLVVLSACETGQGKIVLGEGLMGLTRAFMLAGATRVIVSLWPVEDEATKALMVRFYKLWKKGKMPAATALRKAQDHVRGKKAWAHPAYWAAWQLWGLPD